MRNILIFILLSVIVVMGCITEPPEVTPNTEQGDLEVISFELLNESSLFLGDSSQFVSEISSTSTNASYIVSIKIGEELVYSKEFKGNLTLNDTFYVPFNGKNNLTLHVYSKDLSNFIEKNLENNEITIPFYAYSYGRYDFLSSTTNYSIISNEKIHSVKLNFDNPVYISSVASIIRTTAQLNINSKFIYEIVNDNDGVPGNESLFELTVPIYKIGNNWEFLLLQGKNQLFEPGTYWLNIYVDDKNFLNLACHNVLNSTNTYIGNKISDEIRWKQADCEPYFMISSSKLIETGYDFENRFSIFDVNLSNSS